MSVVGLSQQCKRWYSGCGCSIADVNERIHMVMFVCSNGVRGESMGAVPEMLHAAETNLCTR